MGNITRITGDSNIAISNVQSSNIRIFVQDGLDDEVQSLKIALKKKLEGLKDTLFSRLKELKKNPNGDENNVLDSRMTKILRALEAEKCVLFLGPEIAREEPGKELNIHEQSHISLEAPERGLIYNREEGFFEPYEDIDEIELSQLMFYKKQFYRQNAIGREVISHLSKLPFKMILNFAPDESIVRTWEKYDRDFEYLYYEPGAVFDDITPGKDRPLIINALGSPVSDGGRYIYTHQKFYKYISEAELPANAKNTIKQAFHLVFIGFDFRKWYTRLLLFLLDLPEIPKKEKHFHYSHHLFNEQIEGFLKTQFSITNIKTSYLSFAKQLGAKAQKEKLGIDLKEFFLKKQLLKLESLAEEITDARQLKPLNAAKKELEAIISLVENHA